MHFCTRLIKNRLFFGLLTIVLLAITFSSWAIGSAIGSSPDEDHVLTTIWCGEHSKNIQRSNISKNEFKQDKTASSYTDLVPATDYCAYDSEDYKYLLIPFLVASPQQCLIDVGQDESAACQSPQKATQARKFFESAVDSRYIESLRIFVGPDVESSVVKMRLFNSFLAAVLIVAASAFLRKENSDLLLAWFAVAAPVTTFFIGSVNTSSWTLIGTSCFTLAFVTLLKNRKQPKIWVPAFAISLFSLWFANSSRKEVKYMIILLGAAILYSEFAPRRLKLTKKSVLMVSAILPVIYLIFGYF